MFEKQLQCLTVGKMAVPTPDPVFQRVRITTFIKHFFVIVRLQKCGMTLFEVIHHVLAGPPDIRKDPNVYTVRSDDKTVRIASIVKFWESNNGKATNSHGLVWLKMSDE